MNIHYGFLRHINNNYIYNLHINKNKLLIILNSYAVYGWYFFIFINVNHWLF
ncbi:hypothetical protein Xind_02620 [Xenorhabdus indica]|nr:hypothetical protein [Xenorhabdus indica]